MALRPRSTCACVPPSTAAVGPGLHDWLGRCCPRQWPLTSAYLATKRRSRALDRRCPILWVLSNQVPRQHEASRTPVQSAGRCISRACRSLRAAVDQAETPTDAPARPRPSRCPFRTARRRRPRRFAAAGDRLPRRPPKQAQEAPTGSPRTPVDPRHGSPSDSACTSRPGATSRATCAGTAGTGPSCHAGSLAPDGSCRPPTMAPAHRLAGKFQQEPDVVPGVAHLPMQEHELRLQLAHQLENPRDGHER